MVCIAGYQIACQVEPLDVRTDLGIEENGDMGIDR